MDAENLGDAETIRFGSVGLVAAIDGLRPTPDLVTDLWDAFAGLRTAARSLPPTRIIPALMGQVAVIDAVRHDAAGTVRQDLARLQTRLAETLSWMCEESGDVAVALYWVDRTGEWPRRSEWAAMHHYSAIRRSMLALSTAGHGLAAIEYAAPIIDATDAPARLRSMAAKQTAFGHAIAGYPDAARRALDLAAVHLVADDDRNEQTSVWANQSCAGHRDADVHGHMRCLPRRWHYRDRHVDTTPCVDHGSQCAKWRDQYRQTRPGVRLGGRAGSGRRLGV